MAASVPVEPQVNHNPPLDYNLLPILTDTQIREIFPTTEEVSTLLRATPVPQLEVQLGGRFDPPNLESARQSQNVIADSLPLREDAEVIRLFNITTIPGYFDAYTALDWKIFFQTNLTHKQLLMWNKRTAAMYRTIFPLPFPPQEEENYRPSVEQIHANISWYSTYIKVPFMPENQVKIVKDMLTYLSHFNIFHDPTYGDSLEYLKPNVRKNLQDLEQWNEWEFVTTIREKLLPEDLVSLMNLAFCSNEFNLEVDPLRKYDRIVTFIFEDEKNPGFGKVNSGDCLLEPELQAHLNKFTGPDKVTLWRFKSHPVFKLPYSGIWVQAQRPFLDTFNTFLLRKLGKIPIGSEFGVSALHGSAELVYRAIPIHRAGLLQEPPIVTTDYPFVPNLEDFQTSKRAIYAPKAVIILSDDGNFTYHLRE